VTSVFLSYKREDETMAARLVLALEEAGFTVWWDRGLPGGEEWRAHIEKALNEARCVIVLWTHASVAPEGTFVREEAARARARNILVPVIAETVEPPLGFAEVQGIDLTHWRGNRADPAFKDLTAAVHAKLEGRPVPASRGPTARIYRRLAAGATFAGLLIAGLGFGLNALGVQDQLCEVPAGQPMVSDACGALGIGHRPTRSDRLAWASRPLGDCGRLRDFAGDERSYYSGTAADMLSAATHERAQSFTPARREWRSYIRTSERPFPNVTAARTDAERRAAEDATRQGCAPRDEFERLMRVDVTPEEFDCRDDPRGGFTCGLDYVAECHVEVRAIIERCD